MKKLIILILLSFLLFSCNSKKESNSNSPSYPYEIVSRQVDMSSYEGVNSTDHNFKAIRVSELFNCIDNKSSGIFYLGRSSCHCCQDVTKYMNQAAKKANVTVYYIDVYDDQEPLTNAAIQDKLAEYMDEILNVDENGEKVLLTPQVFAVVNGEFTGTLVCYDNIDFTSINPSEKQVDNLVNKYLEIFEPFAN